MTSPHGIPVDLLDRLVIIRTETYGPTKMIQVLILGIISVGLFLSRICINLCSLPFTDIGNPSTSGRD
jgi:DNA helicase TIP49 (TBP-interacting protein)